MKNLTAQEIFYNMRDEIKIIGELSNEGKHREARKVLQNCYEETYSNLISSNEMRNAGNILERLCMWGQELAWVDENFGEAK